MADYFGAQLMSRGSSTTAAPPPLINPLFEQTISEIKQICVEHSDEQIRAALTLYEGDKGAAIMALLETIPPAYPITVNDVQLDTIPAFASVVAPPPETNFPLVNVNMANSLPPPPVTRAPPPPNQTRLMKNQASTQLFVEGLPDSATKYSVFACFVRFGYIVNLVMLPFRPGKPRACYVHFATDQQVASAAKEKHMLSGIELHVRVSPKPGPKPASAVTANINPHAKVLAKGIAPSVPIELLKEYFGKFGQVISIEMLPAIPNKIGRACTVQFTDLAYAEAASQPNNTHILHGMKFYVHKFDEQNTKVPKTQHKKQSTVRTSPFNVTFSNKVVAFWDTENTPRGGGKRISQIFGLYENLLKMGNRILELSTQVTGNKHLQLTGFAIANTQKQEQWRISVEAMRQFAMCDMFKIQDASEKENGVDITIFKKFIALMRDFYENHQAPAALVLISGDGDFITIIQWCKAVQLPCVLISDATNVSAALIAEMKEYKLGIFCPFQNLLPDVKEKKDPIDLTNSSQLGKTEKKDKKDRKDKKDKKEKKDKIDLTNSSQLGKTEKKDKKDKKEKKDKKCQVVTPETWFFDCVENGHTLSSKPGTGTIACIQHHRGSWCIARFITEPITQLCHNAAGRIFMTDSATFVSFNPANIGAPLTCSSNVPGNYQRLRIEKEDTKSGPVIHTGDIVRLRFDDSPSAFVEVRGTNVYAGGKPSLFQIIANVAEKAVKIPHSVKTDATPPVSTVPSRPGDISDECKQQ